MKKISEVVLVIISAFLLGVVVGMQVSKVDSKTEVIMETYTVKPRDTFWDIANYYRAKDARNPYILEYQHELQMINPAVNVGNLQVGDKITIQYYKDY